VPSLRLLSVVILVGMGATVAALGGDSGDSGETAGDLRGGLIARPDPTSAPSTTRAAAVTSGPAFDVKAENRKPGTPNWRITRAEGTAPGLAGYAGALSVLPGQPVPLAVDGNGPVRIRALRIGWYDGDGARQVWQGTLRAQPETGDPAQWPARGLADTTGWPEGHYLLRLDQGKASRYLPLTVRSADNAGRIVVLTSPLTWQAENTPAAPATVAPEPLPTISFNRPYAGGFGAAGFLQHDSAVVQLAERSGARIGFLTDYDVATDPTLLKSAAAVLVGGDSQFWTGPLRTAIRSAGDAGTNLAFFGAGTGARPIQLADDGRGLQISRAKPAASVKITGQRPSCSIAPPGSSETPDSAGSSPNDADWVVSDADWWGYKHTELHKDDVLPGLVTGRTDRVSTSSPGSPKPLQVLTYNQVPCPGKTGTVVQTGAYLVRSSGAGVFAAGTGRWACALTGSCTNPSGAATKFDPDTRKAVVRITRNVIDAFAKPEAGRRLKATDTTGQYPALG
jgi:hypothetical protein